MTRPFPPDPRLRGRQDFVHVAPVRDRVLAALQDLSVDGWTASVREVAAIAGVQTSGAYYQLLKLVREGLAEQHPRNTHLGWRAKRPD